MRGTIPIMDKEDGKTFEATRRKKFSSIAVGENIQPSHLEAGEGTKSRGIAHGDRGGRIVEGGKGGKNSRASVRTPSLKILRANVAPQVIEGW